MEFINSKNIFLLMKDTLKLKDPELIEHGERVAYMVYRMLQCRGGYEPFELADICIYATLHDMGAYVTEKPGMMAIFDTRQYIPHSVLGFLMCKYMSPHPELAPVLLNHHIDYCRFRNMLPWQRELAAVFNIADRMDIYHNYLQEKFDCHFFDKYTGKKLWDRGMKYFYQADKQYGLISSIENGSYRGALDELSEYIIFSNEEDDLYLGSIMYFLGIRSRIAVVDAGTCICVCGALADRMMLTAVEKRILYYAALLHDVGMLAVPKEIIEAPRKLTGEEYAFLQTHVTRAEEILRDRMAREVVEVIAAHHERGDGSGYPRKLREGQMTQLQRVLQVADTFTALINERSYRRRMDKKDVIGILREEQRKGKFNKQLVDILVNDYDEIYDETRHREADVMGIYQKLLKDYDKVSGQYWSDEKEKGKAQNEIF